MKFQQNEGTIDRVIRAVLGAVLIYGSYAYLTGILQIVLYVIGAISVITAVTGFCGLYTICKISTVKKK